MATPAQLVSQSRFYKQNLYYTPAKPQVKTNNDLASLQISVYLDPKDRAGHALFIQFCNQLSSDLLKNNTFRSKFRAINCKFVDGNLTKNAIYLSQDFILKTNLNPPTIANIENTFQTSVAALPRKPVAPGASFSS